MVAHLASLSFLFIGASYQIETLTQSRLTDDALVKICSIPPQLHLATGRFHVELKGKHHLGFARAKYPA